MFRNFLILILLPTFSSGQDNQQFKLQNSYSIEVNSSICITKNDCYCFNTDSNANFLYMFSSNMKCDKKKNIERIEFSPYKSNIHIYELKQNASHIILWETEYEYFPLILAYYLLNGKLIKMGEIAISLPCEYCEYLRYPLNEVNIKQYNKEIIISFLKDVNFLKDDNTEWNFCKAGDIQYIFNIDTKKLNLVVK